MAIIVDIGVKSKYIVQQKIEEWYHTYLLDTINNVETVLFISLGFS